MNKKIFIILTILSIIFLSIGGTFALITTSMTATNITQIKSGNLTMTISGGGSESVSFVPSKCTSEYAIKKTITAKATNTSGGKVSFSIGLNITALSDTYKKDTVRYALTTNANSCANGLIANGSFKDKTVNSDLWLIKNDYDDITKSGNDYTKTYYLYIWLDESEEEYFDGSISVKLKGTSSNNPNLTTEAETEKTLLYDTIKDNADTTTTINFSKTSVQDNTNGIYTTTDTDSGNPVYYYRGNVDNHLLFANFCWRIVRTTETGGVKLIYNGTQKNAYESITTIEESSYTNVTNDATFPYIFDSTNKTWTSTNKTNSSTGTITFSIDTAGDYILSYVMSSEKNYDKALFYKNGTKLEEHSGTEEGTIILDGLIISDVIKVEYTKDNMDSSGSDIVVFSMRKGEGNPIKSCDNIEDATTIGSSYFGSNDYDAKYVGYMYGSSIDDTANTNDSTIKTIVDTWYKDNMTSYTSQLEDTVFCNDRSYTTNGSNLLFGATLRLYNELDNSSMMPTLKCQNARDKFTVEVSNGNGALMYPVGMITADELAYGGGVWNTLNESLYLYTGQEYWTMSPYSFNSTLVVSGEITMANVGDLFIGNVSVLSYGVRPVISLKSGTAISGGSGTATDPFIVN